MLNNKILSVLDTSVASYREAYPFPHTILDNFLDPWMLRQAMPEIENYQHWHQDNSEWVEEFQVLKQYAPDVVADPNDVQILAKYAPKTKLILDYMYSETVLNFLEDLTGIQGLIPDENWLGAGMHKISRGGKLGVHADFNINFVNNLHRRINVLIYLNEDWNPEWNGHLELWDKDLSKCCVKVEPIFNRAVVFNITDDAFHGHPEPLQCPETVSRYSLALYYYTEDRPEEEKSDPHAVIWYNTK